MGSNPTLSVNGCRPIGAQGKRYGQDFVLGRDSPPTYLSPRLTYSMDVSLYLWLSLASTVSWFISTLAGGGSSLILIPVVGMLLGTAAVPPVITVGGVFGNIGRIVAYRSHICWRLVAWELPGAVVGAYCGAFALTRIEIPWLSAAIALFLLGSAVSYGIKGEAASFTVRPWYFLPGGLIYALFSGLIGSMGPLLAPFYLNYGLTKEGLLATQATNRTAVHLIKVVVYSYFGILTVQTAGLGVLMGVAAFPGNWLGQKALKRISEQQFRRLVIGFVTVSGGLLLWDQRQAFGL